jgi:hypothetical protein
MLNALKWNGRLQDDKNGKAPLNPEKHLFIPEIHLLFLKPTFFLRKSTLALPARSVVPCTHTCTPALRASRSCTYTPDPELPVRVHAVLSWKPSYFFKESSFLTSIFQFEIIQVVILQHCLLNEIFFFFFLNMKSQQSSFILYQTPEKKLLKQFP